MPASLAWIWKDRCLTVRWVGGLSAGGARGSIMLLMTRMITRCFDSLCKTETNSSQKQKVRFSFLLTTKKYKELASLSGSSEMWENSFSLLSHHQLYQHPNKTPFVCASAFRICCIFLQGFSFSLLCSPESHGLGLVVNPL